jgi:hypothetical protein
MYLFALNVNVWSPPEDLTTFALTSIEPTVPIALTSVTRVSIVTFLKASSAASADAWMFDAAAEGEIQIPSINEPLEFAFAVMVTSVGKKLGVIVAIAPTKASEVAVRVWLPDTPLWKPMFENVATPFLEVVVVEVMFVVVPPIVCCKTDELGAVRVTC